MVNIPRHNIPLMQLAGEGIYPRQRTYNRGYNRQRFGLNKGWKREHVIKCITAYLTEMYEASSITFYKGEGENEVIAQWLE